MDFPLLNQLRMLHRTQQTARSSVNSGKLELVRGGVQSGKFHQSHEPTNAKKLTFWATELVTENISLVCQ
ncbi:MAG: hypothetical protein HC820_02735 [Hydrococcus sp. RM1_1_31]|nr:hypothetical protein [Hydrococcus sp. RM1_1_31]